jgi:hypothetical protein
MDQILQTQFYQVTIHSLLTTIHEMKVQLFITNLSIHFSTDFFKVVILLPWYLGLFCYLKKIRVSSFN